MAAQTSRAFGISVSSSLVKLVPMVVVDVSTTGDAPVTVTVSCNVATCSCMSTVSVWLMTTRMPSRFTEPEAGQLEVQVVDAGRQRQEAVVARCARDLHLRLDQRRTRDGHRDAGQHRAGVVRHRAVDTATEVLRRHWQRAQQHCRQTQDQTCRLQPHGHPSRTTGVPPGPTAAGFETEAEPSRNFRRRQGERPSTADDERANEMPPAPGRYSCVRLWRLPETLGNHDGRPWRQPRTV